VISPRGIGEGISVGTRMPWIINLQIIEDASRLWIHSFNDFFLNETVKNSCPGSVPFASFSGHADTMETPTHPLPAKTAIQTPGDDLTLSTALWAIGGFILFAAVIFAIVLYGHL